MKLFFKSDGVKVMHGDCLEVLRKLPDNSIHSIVTDPPYGLSNTDPKRVSEAIVQWASGDREFVPASAKRGFMGKEWDAFVPPPAVRDECLRVLKPGGHLLCFTGSRTIGLMEISIRLAGFEIRDSIAWLHGSGFPKGQNISKSMDKAAGVDRKVVGRAAGAGSSNTESLGKFSSEYDETEDATTDAIKWSGWNTALKPAFEPILMAQKPFKGTIAANVLEHDTGALNIDAGRVGGESRPVMVRTKTVVSDSSRSGVSTGSTNSGELPNLGRYPANVILDESQAATLNEARFFYVAKAPKSERPVVDGLAHPTVKPLALMRYLVKLVTPPGGIVLDPFSGSGTTSEAALLEGFKAFAIEADESYLPLIQARIERNVKDAA